MAAEPAGAVTLADLRRAVGARLQAAGVENPQLDARVLVGAAAGIDPSTVPLQDRAAAAAAVTNRAFAFAARRIAGEPVARIVGRKEFWGLDLTLSPETLVPRPDTETLVEAALGFAAKRRERPLRILDLGTGSGAILLALLSEFSHAVGVGVDLAFGAANAARQNARHLGLEARAAFMVGNWAGSIAGRFDILTANPPYIPAADIAHLATEVRQYDPHLALDGGADGLDAVRDIFAIMPRLLEAGGAGFVEIGVGQREAVSAIADEHGLSAAFIRDLAGIDRVVAVRPKDAR